MKTTTNTFANRDYPQGIRSDNRNDILDFVASEKLTGLFIDDTGHKSIYTDGAFDAAASALVRN